MVKKYWLAFILGVIAVLAMWVYFTPKAEAHKEGPSCKKENAECEINNSNKKCCKDLVCVPFNKRSDNGKCKPIVIPTATPTVEPTVTPTPVDEPEPTETPEATPTATPTKTPAPCTVNCGEPPRFAESSTLPHPPICNGDGPDAPVATGGTRIDSDTVQVRWYPSVNGAEYYILEYGMSPDKLEWGVPWIPGSMDHYELNGVPSGHIWYKVTAIKNNCPAHSATVDP